MSLKRKAADLAADAAKKPKSNASITAFFGQPKPNAGSSPSQPASSPTAAETQPVKFDKDAWVAKLTPEQKELLALEINTLHESWLGVLKDDVVSQEFLDLKRFLKKEVETGKKVFPPSGDVYSWYSSPRLPVRQLELIPFFQVSSHTAAKRQSRHPRPGPLPQRQPSPRSLLLRPSTNCRSTLTQEHVHRAQKRLPILQRTAQKRRPSYSLGRPRRPASQYLSDCPRTRSQ